MKNVDPLGPSRENLRCSVVHTVNNGRNGEIELLGAETGGRKSIFESFVLPNANPRLFIGFGLPPVCGVGFRNVDDIDLS